MNWTEQQINECAEYIAQTFDLNPDVKPSDVVAEFAGDNDLPAPYPTLDIIIRYQVLWTNHQKEAGVDQKYWKV